MAHQIYTHALQRCDCLHYQKRGSEAQLELTDQGMVRYALKTAYLDGTTRVVLERMDFMAKLAAVVPRPRTNLTLFHEVLAPNSGYREHIIPTRSVKENTTTDRRGRWTRRPRSDFGQAQRNVLGAEAKACFLIVK